MWINVSLTNVSINAAFGKQNIYFGLFDTQNVNTWVQRTAYGNWPLGDFNFSDTSGYNVQIILKFIAGTCNSSNQINIYTAYLELIGV